MDSKTMVFGPSGNDSNPRSHMELMIMYGREEIPKSSSNKKRLSLLASFKHNESWEEELIAATM